MAEQLRAGGLRRTPARVAVLQVLGAQSRGLSHADIEAALAEPLDRVTLYRTLDSFVEAGMARREVGEDRISRFVLTDGIDHDEHSHFRCDDCGDVFCLPVKPPRRPALPDGFAMQGASLSFHGQCPKCAHPAPRRPAR